MNDGRFNMLTRRIITYLCICIYFSAYPGMKIHEYHLDLFKREPVATEFYAYQLLKKNPLPQDVHYLAVPWVVLINNGKLGLAPNIKLNGGFTICQHIQFERIIPILKKIGIDTLFTPHVELGKKYDGITVLPFPHYTVNTADPAAHKDLLYSFMGLRTSGVRDAIFNLPQQPDTVIKRRNNWFASSNNRPENKEYKQILSRSRFSLCPRGTGPSTIRFWESLQAGAIPVILSDAMSLPTGFDWSRSVLRVPENQAARLDEIIRSIPPEIEDEMYHNCLKAHTLFLGKNFVRTIQLYYVNR
jgi:hypothetical protein